MLASRISGRSEHELCNPSRQMLLGDSPVISPLAATRLLSSSTSGALGALAFVALCIGLGGIPCLQRWVALFLGAVVFLPSLSLAALLLGLVPQIALGALMGGFWGLLCLGFPTDRWHPLAWWLSGLHFGAILALLAGLSNRVSPADQPEIFASFLLYGLCLSGTPRFERRILRRQAVESVVDFIEKADDSSNVSGDSDRAA